MNKYFECFQNNTFVDIDTINLEDTSATDRYWIFACLAKQYHKTNDKGNAFVSLLHLKRLSFINSIIEKIKPYGDEYIPEKYIPYKLEKEDENLQYKSLITLNKIDLWVTGYDALKKKYYIFGIVFIIISIFLVFLLNKFIRMNIWFSAATSLILDIFYCGIFLPKKARIDIANLRPDENLEYDDRLDKFFMIDNIVDDVFEDEYMLEILKAKSSFEMDEIIRKQIKK